MTKTVRIIAYNKYSKSCAALKNTLGAEAYRVNIYADNTTKTSANEKILESIRSVANGDFVKMNYTNLFINWGDGFKAEPHDALKKIHAFLNCVPLDTFINKKKFFTSFEKFTPKFFTTQADAGRFLAESKDTDRPIIVERTILSGSGGVGIRLLGKRDVPSQEGKLWVEYVPKLREYRVHFFKNPSGAFRTYTQTKLLSSAHVDADIPNKFQIRNHKNGWIYATKLEDRTPACVDSIVEEFLCDKENTLDFGALDIIYNKQTNRAYILELNTAPGLSGSTTAFYADSIKSWAV